ncbi:hypothetical protein ACHAXS_006133 [Conticribra weissflogii]
MVYCALGFGNNFFYPFGSDALPVPSHLLDGDAADDANARCDDSIENNSSKFEQVATTHVSLIPLQPDSHTAKPLETESAANSASEWLLSKVLVKTEKSNNGSISSATTTEYASTTLPITTCGATHTSIVLPASSSKSPAGQAHILGTIFGHTFPRLTLQPSRLPLRIIRVSSGRRHVLALTEGAAPLSGGGSGGGGVGGGAGFGGGVVMSWGAGHFGQLGHGPDVTSCMEPKIVERLLPHVVGGQVIEIAAGGLHSAAIVASSSSKNQKIIPPSNKNDILESAIIVRETRTFAWGSNRKGQCGIEGGKCATVPAPVPVVTVKRAEATSSRRDNGSGGSSKTAPVDKVVHFEKLALGRVHTVAITAYGEVFSWGSTSMGRCGHSMEGGRGISADRRICQEPRFVSALRNVAIESIAAGDAHTLALSKGGRVFAWGAGADGQCGQGHMGNLFSPRAVQQIYFLEGSNSVNKSEAHDEVEVASKSADEDITGNAGDCGDGGNEMPRINSKVAMEVAMEEEAFSKELAMTQTTYAPDSKEHESPKEKLTPRTQNDVKIATIHASGCYSAALTTCGAVYTWGYAGGAAMGHPVPPPDSCLPLLPLIEGNQFSSITATKVYPEGGSGENIIRDCRAFDTDLNVMLPRKVECIDKLGLVAKNISLGPDHMVILCSTRSGAPEDDITIADSMTDKEILQNENESSYQKAANDKHPIGFHDQSLASESAEGLSSLTDAYSPAGRGVTALSTTSTFGDVSTVATFESADTSEYSKYENRRNSHGWMNKIRSSRLSGRGLTHEPQLDGPSQLEPSATGGREKDKKKSFLHMGKFLDAAFHRNGK